LLKYLE